jgi:putative oxidoreductase
MLHVINKIEKWGDTHHPAWIDFIRMLLGLVIVWKGVEFALNLDAFSKLMAKTGLITSLGISLFAHAIIFIHIIGGLMIAIGTHTRTSCLFQIPILLVAVFYVNLPEHVFKPYSEFWLSLSVLIALVFFLVEGNGPLSVEHEDYPKHAK